MRIFISLLALAFLLPIVFSSDRTSSYQDFQSGPQLIDVDEEIPSSEQNGRLLSDYPQVRMAALYDALDSAPANFRQYMEKQLVPAVFDYFQAALKVKYPIKSNIKVSSLSETVCGIPTPDILKNEGIAADYVILFDSAVDQESAWVAESYSCYLSSISKRPYIAKTVFNRELLKDASDNVLLHEKNIYLLMHEIFHTLGFSKSLYRYFLDPNGQPMTNHIKKVKMLGADRMVLDVPALTGRLRRFFGCPTLQGLFLENDGNAASAGSHLERRYFLMEHMTSGLLYDQKVSEFSLGLLEASGWYIPDYSFAEPYFFGQGKGCGFFSESCTSRSFDYESYGYCRGNSFGCSANGRGGGKCVGDSKSEECRYIKPNVDYDCENPEAAAFVRLPSLQAFGREAGSKCFAGTLSASASSGSSTIFCFTYKCIGAGEGIKLSVNVGNQTVICSQAGPVNVAGYQGNIVCPDPLNFCETIGKRYCPRNCMGRGKCVDNKCVCRPGFVGNDCGIIA